MAANRIGRKSVWLLLSVLWVTAPDALDSTNGRVVVRSRSPATVSERCPATAIPRRPHAPLQLAGTPAHAAETVSVAVVPAGRDQATLLAQDVVASDLAGAAGLTVVPLETVRASLPVGSKRVSAGNLGAIAQACGATHAVLVSVAGGSRGYRLTAVLAAMGGEVPMPLQAAPRAFRYVEDVRFHAHQAANLAAVKLTGGSLPGVPGIFEDRLRGKTLGVGRTTQVRENPALQGLKVTLEIDRPGGTYSVGERVECSLTVERDCHIAIYNIDPSGKLALLVPSQDCEPDKIRQQGNRWVSALKVKGGVRYRVPADWAGEDATFLVLEGHPVGYEALVAVAGTEPVRLPVVRKAGRKDLTIVPVSPVALAREQASLLVQQAKEGGLTGKAEVNFTTVGAAAGTEPQMQGSAE